MPRPPLLKIPAHQKGDRNRERQCAGAPWVVGQRIHDGQAETCQGHHDDEQDRHSGGGAGDGADLVAGDLRQGATVASHGRHQNDEVLHGTSQHGADDEPEKSGKETELRSQDRP